MFLLLFLYSSVIVFFLAPSLSFSLHLNSYSFHAFPRNQHMLAADSHVALLFIHYLHAEYRQTNKEENLAKTLVEFFIAPLRHYAVRHSVSHSHGLYKEDFFYYIWHSIFQTMGAKISENQNQKICNKHIIIIQQKTSFNTIIVEEYCVVQGIMISGHWHLFILLCFFFFFLSSFVFIFDLPIKTSD